MPLSFPLSLATFWTRLPIDSFELDLGEALQLDETGGGEQLTADLGVRLWRGTVTMGRLRYAEAAEVEVLLDTLRQAGRFFLGNDARRPRPLADPTGAILGAAAVTVSAIPSTRELTLAGLPAGYVLSPGDYLSFTYDGTNARRGFHRVVTGGAASGGGVLGPVEIVPPLRPGLTTGTAVTLSSPVFKACLLAGTAARGASRRQITEGSTFGFIQTLR